MQALSENICAHLCLGSQWPLRNGIYLRVRVSHEKLFAVKVPDVIYYADRVPSHMDYNKIICPCFISETLYCPA